MPETVDTERVQALVAAGAQLVDVLPAENYAQEHLPGAVNLPLAQIAAAGEQLAPSRPTVVYCFDYQCDLSPRAAHRLEVLGFTEVYDYVAGKAAWLAEGLPGEGLLRDEDRAGAATRRNVPRVGLQATLADVAAVIDGWELVVVVDDQDVVAGVVRTEATGGPDDLGVAKVMEAAPPTVRPSISRAELARSMDDHGERHVLVTTLSGMLVGLVRREDLRGG
jgi:rhodanese-related sulfurtransferase